MFFLGLSCSDDDLTKQSIEMQVVRFRTSNFVIHQRAPAKLLSTPANRLYVPAEHMCTAAEQLCRPSKRMR